VHAHEREEEGIEEHMSYFGFARAGHNEDRGRGGGVGKLSGGLIDIEALGISLIRGGARSLRSSNLSPSQKNIRIIFAMSSTPQTSGRQLMKRQASPAYPMRILKSPLLSVIF
jgi:hypothetical protein